MASGTDSIDLQQVVEGKLTACERPLNSSSGSAVKHVASHEGAVVQTQNGDWYFIDFGVDSSDDINFRQVYREGQARIALVQEKDLQSWKLTKSVTVRRSGVKLEKLLQACNDSGEYNFACSNCWNAVERMKKCVDPDNSDWSWQNKTIGSGIALAIAAGAGVGLWALSSSSRNQEKKEEMNTSDPPYSSSKLIQLLIFTCMRSLRERESPYSSSLFSRPPFIPSLMPSLQASFNLIRSQSLKTPFNLN